MVFSALDRQALFDLATTHPDKEIRDMAVDQWAKHYGRWKKLREEMR